MDLNRKRKLIVIRFKILRVLSDKYSFFMVGPGTKKRQMT